MSLANRARVITAMAVVGLCGAGCAAGSDDGGSAAQGNNFSVGWGGSGGSSGSGVSGVAGSVGVSGQAAPPSMIPQGGSGAVGGCGPDGDCAPLAGTGGGAAGMAGMMPAPPAAPGTRLDPNQPTCFEFRNHGQPVSGDTSKYPVPPGEQYVCNHYDVPWNEPAELVSWQTLYDNTSLLHHWLLYSVPPGQADGSFFPCIGTHVLQDAQLVAGWAVGSNDVDMPEDVGMRMPGSDRGFLLEWHFYNSTGTPQPDGSGISICVLPQGTRPKLAGMTWLGTEDLGGPVGMPPGQVSEYGGTCVNDSNGPITIFRLWPHMHQWGRHMTSVVTRVGGATENVFSMPFDFNYQISYPTAITLMPGDSIRSTCRFENQSLGSVPFGPSSDQEMCYQFAFSYPAGELDNGVPSLVGATNTCW